MNHTPTPWTAEYGDTIWAATGPVGDVNKTDDLAFIVKACNAHDELVAALKDALHLIADPTKPDADKMIAITVALAKAGAL